MEPKAGNRQARQLHITERAVGIYRRSITRQVNYCLTGQPPIKHICLQVTQTQSSADQCCLCANVTELHIPETHSIQRQAAVRLWRPVYHRRLHCQGIKWRSRHEIGLC